MSKLNEVLYTTGFAFSTNNTQTCIICPEIKKSDAEKIEIIPFRWRADKYWFLDSLYVLGFLSGNALYSVGFITKRKYKII